MAVLDRYPKTQCLINDVFVVLGEIGRTILLALLCLGWDFWDLISFNKMGAEFEYVTLVGTC